MFDDQNLNFKFSQTHKFKYWSYYTLSSTKKISYEIIKEIDTNTKVEIKLKQEFIWVKQVQKQ